MQHLGLQDLGGVLKQAVPPVEAIEERRVHVLRETSRAREQMLKLLGETHEFLERKLAGSLQKERLLAETREQFERELSR